MAHSAGVDKVAEHFHTRFIVGETAEVQDHVVARRHMLASQHRPDRVK